MGRSVSDIRDLMRLAGSLRQSAHVASLPGYAERLLQAAAEIEARARLFAEHINDPDFDETAEHAAYRHVDVRV